MMSCKSNRQNTWNPAMRWGVILNAVVLLLHYGFPALLPDSLLRLLQGFTIGLMLVGLFCLSPERAAWLKGWKARHLHF